jgi:hypothetical protein
MQSGPDSNKLDVAMDLRKFGSRLLVLQIVGIPYITFRTLDLALHMLQEFVNTFQPQHLVIQLVPKPHP